MHTQSSDFSNVLDRKGLAALAEADMHESVRELKVSRFISPTHTHHTTLTHHTHHTPGVLWGLSGSWSPPVLPGAAGVLRPRDDLEERGLPESLRWSDRCPVGTQEEASY